jgi:hypothetical protein
VSHGRGSVSLPHGCQHQPKMRHRSIQLVRRVGGRSTTSVLATPLLLCLNKTTTIESPMRKTICTRLHIGSYRRSSGFADCDDLSPEDTAEQTLEEFAKVTDRWWTCRKPSKPVTASQRNQFGLLIAFVGTGSGDNQWGTWAPSI